MISKERKEIVFDIVRRYNKGEEKNITKLCNEYENYNRNKFYRDIDKLGINKDDEIDKYIQLDTNILKDEEEPKEDKKDTVMEEEKETQRKKKTFEITEGVEAGIRIMATLEEKTMNDYVNDTLEASISEEVKEMLGEAFKF